MKRILMAFLSALPAVVVGAENFAEADIRFFEKEVRPLLNEHCIRCHGGKDGKGKVKIKSGLQLISRKGIALGGDRGSAYDASEPEKSLLLHALSYEDEDLSMPPKEQLDERSREVFKDWVERGMPWSPEDADRLVEGETEDHAITTVNAHSKNYWSYKPMKRPVVPVVDSKEWKAPIDAYIWDGVSKLGIQPNEKAKRSELIRRAYYNLTGLPPSLTEVNAFENDRSPDAWEKVIDRLLASPGYGEKWARHWLDLVRYAGTNGFERDNDKPFVWRYRDYVIRAFNEDKPYDLFLREQLAGDEFENPTFDSLVATGYHHLMQWDDEPADRKKHYYDLLDDNVRTTSEVMLGMTLGCARCHDHKGDPIPQEDYYQFMAFFRGVLPYSEKPSSIEMVEIEGRDDGYEGRLKGFRDRENELKRELAQAEQALQQDAQTNHLKSDEASADDLSDDDAFISDARSKRPHQWYYSLDHQEGWSEVGFRAELHQWKTGQAGFGTKGPEMFSRTNWATPNLWLQTTFLLEAIPTKMAITLHHDENVEIFLNGQLVIKRKGFRVNYDEFLADAAFLDALQVGRNVIAVQLTQTVGGQYFDMGLGLSEASVWSEARLNAAKKRGEGDSGLLKKREKLSKLLKAHQVKSPSRGEPILTAREKGEKVDPTYLHIRGNANSEDLKREMELQVPMIFGGEKLAAKSPPGNRPSSGRRTALAEWITREDNPRTARVMMNRVWQHHFGRGLCRTSSDFGFLGEKPTHPELLDWLASEFVSQGWSLKRMHKIIMMSQAYQMSARRKIKGEEEDPDNNRFWRFNMRRLTAEEVRDSILALTGKLNRKMGGPGVYLPLPKEVLATASKKGAVWGKSSPEEIARRSIYVKVKRSLIPPQFADLDMADTDTSCPVRFTTTVPTQALGFLNSMFMNDQAKLFAQRLRSEANEKRSEIIRLALELALSRPVDERELAYGDEFFETMRNEHGLSEEHALDRFALLVLNLNEFIFLD